ncbi:unnamed protein product [Rotaria socialis]|uniref:non-specific protein-tyrosine kinase n=1 Tax=Rotaria socialis TaxID=392032 RepID=A0A821G824_9BILA|nr:unnamed protein product [Rotaria socialis]CAF3682482.1 unnamed protein product [Rotaria socialis]CAF3782224.1 unnamed protein product [Rotaria socialis]CAF4226912.1 unnamed protein product [Rotaria socialis]CAF4532732.1 unnamed protein product [Rotaria socialis]
MESDKLISTIRPSLVPRSSKLQKDIRCSQRRSTTCVTSMPNNTNKKTNYVQLYKPIYIADCCRSINAKCSYEKGDEFELVAEINEEYKHLIHLRTNSECIINRRSLQLDSETPLRLGSDDRGVIQRCLLQYNVPGAYLIRRSNTESNSFVLSIAQVSNQRHAEDWHYLIHTDPISYRFYFAQESRLQNLSFTSFQQLIQDENVRKFIPLSEIIPCRIEFEEDLWHIPTRNLTFQFPIGKGEFGEVWRALWKHGHRSIPVAVKKLNPLRHDKATIDSFIREIETMKTLRNNFIVACYGVAQDINKNETLLITELMENGDLKNWLKFHQDVPSENIIISYAYDVCRGMLFLEQKSCLHRDLACRNLLLSDGGKTIKIADFGLSTIVNKDDFLQRNEVYSNKVPIRWTAPEVLQDRATYSIKSDVWSFGIVLIEIWLKGDDPYPEEKSFDSIRALVFSGYVHLKPLKCSKQFYNRLILPCLYYESYQRPSFKTLGERLNRWNEEKDEYDRLNRPCVKDAS